MTKQTKNGFGCCKIEAVVPVDKRGQMVLPKEIREKAQIKGGDKLAVITGEQNGQGCLIALVKVEKLEETVKSILKALGKHGRSGKGKKRYDGTALEEIHDRSRH